GVFLPATETVAELYDQTFAWSEANKQFLYLCFKVMFDNEAFGVITTIVFKDIVKLWPVVGIATEGVEANDTMRQCQQSCDLFYTHRHFGSKVFQRGVTLHILFQLLPDIAQAFAFGYFVRGYTNGSSLFAEGISDGLTNPPRGIGAQLTSLTVVKLIDCVNQANVPLLNEIHKVQTQANILTRNTNDEAEVGLDQLAFSFLTIFDEMTI